MFFFFEQVRSPLNTFKNNYYNLKIVVCAIGKNQERMGRGSEEREGERRKKTKSNQRQRGDITVDGIEYSLQTAAVSQLIC